MNKLKLKLAGGTVALVAAVGGGAALAADKLSPKQESDAIVADAAKELGVTSAKLEAALKQALTNRVDAAVADGRVTAEQATELKARIAAGEMPLLGVRGRGGDRGGPGHHGFKNLDAAASFLGLTENALRTRLGSGDTLAEVATAEGKSAAGLVDALVAAAKVNLDQKATDRGLTETQKAAMLADLESRIQDLVDGKAGFGRHHRDEPTPSTDA